MSASPLPRRLRAATGLAAVLAAGVLTGCGGTDATATSAEQPSASSSAPSAPAPSTPAPSTPAPSTPAPSTSAAPSSAPGGGAPTATDLRAALVDFAVELPETDLSAGTYTFEVTNEGGASHDLVVEGPDGQDVGATEILAPGGSDSLEVTLEPGEYVFYCSVGTHRAMGMELVVTVT